MVTWLGRRAYIGQRGAGVFPSGHRPRQQQETLGEGVGCYAFQRGVLKQSPLRWGVPILGWLLLPGAPLALLVMLMLPVLLTRAGPLVGGRPTCLLGLPRAAALCRVLQALNAL